MAKLPNIDGRLDKISNVPDAILCHIITFLPIKEAVRTSVLSTRWRYLFASMTTVHFDDRGLCRSTHGKRFINFVDRLMFFPREASLDCLRVDFMTSYIGSSRIYGWICAALLRGVKKLDLVFDSEDVLAFHNLVELEIVENLDQIYDDINCFDCGGMWVGEFLKCSPNLQTLVLSLARSGSSFFRGDFIQIGVWSPPEMVPSCLLSCLKEIVLCSYDVTLLFKLIKYFLNNARVLEKLTIRIDTHKLNEKEELRFTKEVLALPRCSERCQVLIDYWSKWGSILYPSTF
ncbi:hypothetical protein COLO4_11300 [Corchorus olitorius]|uniref:F-box domain-containing protein n=1 Tax=Corchorus olitorius TaxID=93759 RepID=A0A1R3K4Y6_9ROSI|nr:hypothetical protein COLO4_11300 [Corchorus olitorius]